jgi:hypothetical protein
MVMRLWCQWRCAVILQQHDGVQAVHTMLCDVALCLMSRLDSPATKVPAVGLLLSVASAACAAGCK